MKYLKITLILSLIVLGFYLFLENYIPPLDENHGKVHTKLYLGESENQPLVVGFAGGEGGNAWESDRWKPTRDEFIKRGYAFLSIGYFGMKDTPNSLDRISLNAIHDAILEIAKNPKINRQKIAIIGASKGGELVLNLASYFDDIDAVVAIVPSHVSFPSLTIMSNTSSWTLNNKEIPFVPAPYSAVPAMLKGDLRGAFRIILENKEAEAKALIPVEKINGSILLVSATKDNQWDSTEMSDKVIKRLENSQFKHYYKHIPIEGNHAEPLNHFDLVFDFLENQLVKK
jgi:uncharacterized protein